MDHAVFRQLLALHGSDLSCWPEPLAAEQAVADAPSLAELLQRERRFEALLGPTEAPAAPWLAERIIARSRDLPQARGRLAGWLHGLLGESRLPVPAMVCAVLLLGFALSFELPDDSEATPVAYDVSDVDLLYGEAAL